MQEMPPPHTMTLADLERASLRSSSYERMPNLLMLEGCARDRLDWFRVLGISWTTSDNISLYREHLDDILFLADPEEIAAMMTPGELEAYTALPEIFTIYRGCYEWNMEGLSWTLSRAIAERFPYLYRYCHIGKEAFLLEATAHKRNCVLKLNRDEAEVICWWRDCVEVASLGTVTTPGCPKVTT